MSLAQIEILIIGAEAIHTLLIPKDETVLEIAAAPARHVVLVADREAEPGAGAAQALVKLEDAAMHFKSLAGAGPVAVPDDESAVARAEKRIAPGCPLGRGAGFCFVRCRAS